MTRLAALTLLLLAGPASAETLPSPEEELETQGYISAARPGSFSHLPPSPNGFPADVLATMRIKLGGERPLPAAPAATPETPKDGH